MTQTRTKIYFAINTEDQSVDDSTISKYINIPPTKFELMFARGHIPKCTIWEYALPEFTNWDIQTELNKIVSVMQPFKNGLIKLKEEYDVSFVIQLVLYIGEETPSLHFGSSVTKFASEIEAEIDCDMYNEK